MASTVVQPYLFFGGRCDEAIEFYKTAVGAQVEMVMRFSDSPEPPPPGMVPPGYEDKVMHASFKVGDSVVMVSDGNQEGQNFQGFSLSYGTDSLDDAHRAFEALSAGGQVTMPLAPTFWAALFGMCTDKFGVGWMVNVESDHDK